MAGNHHAAAVSLDSENQKNRCLLHLQRSGKQFSDQAAWTYFEAQNVDAAIECYRQEFSTLLDLMRDWRFEQIVVDMLIDGDTLDVSLAHAQTLLEEQARKRVTGFLYRPCKKASSG